MYYKNLNAQLFLSKTLKLLFNNMRKIVNALML